MKTINVLRKRINGVSVVRCDAIQNERMGAKSDAVSYKTYISEFVGIFVLFI